MDARKEEIQKPGLCAVRGNGLKKASFLISDKPRIEKDLCLAHDLTVLPTPLTTCDIYLALEHLRLIAHIDEVFTGLSRD